MNYFSSICPGRWGYSLAQFLIRSLCLLMLGAGVLGAAPSDQPPVPVEVAVATLKPVAPLAWLPGTVMSRNDAQLAAEITDRLMWVAEVGDTVKKGDVVARVKNNTARYTLERFEAEVRRESARSQYLQSEVKRLTRLARNQNVSQSLLDQTTSELNVSLNQLKSNKAQMELARGNLARTEIQAPFDGVVSERLLMPGEWAEAGNPVVRLVDTRQLEIKVPVPIRYLELIKVGDQVHFQASASQGDGVVRAIVPVGDLQSQQFDLRIGLPADGPWAPGRAMRVAVPAAQPREALVIPRDALVLRREGTAVFKVNPDHSVTRVAVETGIAAGADIEVIGAIQPGDRVVTHGGERLRPDQVVQVKGAEGAQ